MILLVACCATQVRADWPFARGGADSAGVTAVDLGDEAHVAWTYDAAGSSLEATPVVTGGVAYFGDVDGTFHAVNVSDGSLVWKQPFEKTGFLSPACVAGGTVYAPDMNGFVRALAIEDGTERWSFDTESEVYAGPLVHKLASGQQSGQLSGQSLLLVPTEGGTLHTLDAATGEKLWEFTIDAPLRCTPTVVGGCVLLAGCDAQLHTVDIATGKEIGACDIGDPTGNTAAVVAGVAYFGTESGEFLAVDASDTKNPAVVWRYHDPRRGQGIRTAAAVSTAAVVYASQAKTAYGLDPKSGDELWRQPARSRIEASPLGVAGGRVLIATSRGRAMLLDAKSGDEVWTYEAGGGFLASPAASDGVVLLPNTDGRMYAFGKE